MRTEKSSNLNIFSILNCEIEINLQKTYEYSSTVFDLGGTLSLQFQILRHRSKIRSLYCGTNTDTIYTNNITFLKLQFTIRVNERKQHSSIIVASNYDREMTRVETTLTRTRAFMGALAHFVSFELLKKCTLELELLLLERKLTACHAIKPKF
jgi:hypothetical protein